MNSLERSSFFFLEFEVLYYQQLPVLSVVPKVVVATSEGGQQPSRTPLRTVVAECEGRWFNATKSDAMNGDVPSQSLIGQMLLSGYGTPQDAVQVPCTCTQNWLSAIAFFLSVS